MDYYVVGFYKPVYGDALVKAESSSEALRKVRSYGYTPNPGDRYILPSSGQFPEDHIMSYNNDELLGIREAPVDEMTILWEQKRG